MDLWLDRLTQKAPPLVLASVGLGLLLCAYGSFHLIKTHTLRVLTETVALIHFHEQSHIAFHHYQSLADLKKSDVARFKEGMSNVAQSNKTMFETGLSLHEEKRLLEKQWEIITTYMSLNTELQRVFLMRGDQPLESYLINYVPLKVFGPSSVTLPRLIRIISKERFANPDRGTSEMVNGKLQWVPPQVGTSVRSNALGEYVIFTNSRMILHGPPLNPIDHEAYPHVCLGLSREAARNLYQHSFIGTKILLGSARVTMQQPEVSTTTLTPLSTAQVP